MYIEGVRLNCTFFNVFPTCKKIYHNDYYNYITRLEIMRRYMHLVI